VVLPDSVLEEAELGVQRHVIGDEDEGLPVGTAVVG
jgi:hypothetical protein